MRSIRKKAIFKAMKKEGNLDDAWQFWLDVQNNKSSHCLICGTKEEFYSEWYDTGYEHEKCTRGCWSVQTYGSQIRFKAEGYDKTIYNSGRMTEEEWFAIYESQLNAFNNHLQKQKSKFKKFKKINYKKRG